MFNQKPNVYLLGPIFGFTEDNYKMFSKAEKLFLSKGHRVSSPKSRDAMVPIPRRSWTTESLFSRNRVWLHTADMGVALPGWRESEIASLEAAVLMYSGVLLVEMDMDLNVRQIDDLPKIIHQTLPKCEKKHVTKDAQNSGSVSGVSKRTRSAVPAKGAGKVRDT